MKKKVIAIAALALCTALCIAAAANRPRAEASGRPQTTRPETTDPKTTQAETTEPDKTGTDTPQPDTLDPITDPILTPGEILPLQPVDFGFRAQYLRTDGYHDGVKYPVVKIIRSVAELNEYYEATKSLYNLREFPAACEKYDEAYFKDHILVMVLVEAGSGSVRYQVTGAALKGDVLNVDISVMAPEAGTADMAEWHILIEPAAGVDVADAEHVSVNLRTTGMGRLPDNDAIRQKITEEQAVEIAKMVVTVEYDYAEARFDEETGAWQVNFGREGWAGGDQTVTLDEYGNILGSVYGE